MDFPMSLFQWRIHTALCLIFPACIVLVYVNFAFKEYESRVPKAGYWSFYHVLCILGLLTTTHVPCLLYLKHLQRIALLFYDSPSPLRAQGLASYVIKILQWFIVSKLHCKRKTLYSQAEPEYQKIIVCGCLNELCRIVEGVDLA